MERWQVGRYWRREKYPKTSCLRGRRLRLYRISKDQNGPPIIMDFGPLIGPSVGPPIIMDFGPSVGPSVGPPIGGPLIGPSVGLGFVDAASGAGA